MKRLYVLAALLMVTAATTTAHAGNSISFEVNGNRVRIEVPRNCDALSCLQITAPGLSGSGFGVKDKSDHFDDNDNNDVAVRSDPPASKKTPAPVVQAAVPQPSTPAVNTTPSTPTAVASTTPAPAVTNDVAPAAQAPAAVATAAPTPTAVAPAPVETPTTPLGVWATEENKGNVRVEPCGPNLCGYAVKTGAKILINMKPSDTKWTGRIHDPDSGRDYDSTIAMKGPNAMRVQGCAFGGMFCGGQTWKRVS
jgi:uncharacterized protein (DUF2147 family)